MQFSCIIKESGCQCYDFTLLVVLNSYVNNSESIAFFTKDLKTGHQTFV